MNFTGTLNGAERNVELKYCERCGGLFLRTPGAGIVYCGGCAFRMGQDPESAEVISSEPKRRRRGARLKNASADDYAPQASEEIEYLQGVATTEVAAC
jgi:hypothetical protein